jgi:hypothetical protein
MKLRIPTIVILALACAAMLPAADSQLLSLVMPDAKVLAGINVDQAKTSPLGQYLLTQLQAQDDHLRKLTEETGFDPTRDLHEVLIASNGTQKQAPSLALARGTFDITRINAAAQNVHKEVYKGVTIFEDPKGQNGYAFLNPTLGLAGDLASVKGAIDRQTAPAPLPASLMVKVNQLSASEDAWGISEVPPPVNGTITVPNGQGIPATVFQNIQQATGGVKLGAEIVATSQLQADTPANATALSSVLQFLLNLVQIQAQKDPDAAALLKTAVIKADGNLVNLSISIPEAQAEKLLQFKPHVETTQPNVQRRGERRL